MTEAAKKLLRYAPLAIIAVGAFALVLPGLDHPSIHNWDEAAHQAVTRGTADSFLRPHIYADLVYPRREDQWMDAGVFLHKPTAPFWFGALMIRLIGVTTLALRLGSFFGLWAAAITIYLLSRRLAGEVLATLGALAWLALPFGFELSQGYLFGDATDCTLVGWVCIAMALLYFAVERDSLLLATLAGASTGVGYLCKTALALVPAGVAIAFAVLGTIKLTKKLRWSALGLYLAATALVAIPWNAYTAHAYPAEYAYEAAHTMKHLFGNDQWTRPWDAILNEINQTELNPIPPALALVALLWGLWRAGKKRETEGVMLALWLAATWIVLSIAHIKVPATAWGAAPAAIALIAVALADALQFAPLAGALAGAAATTFALAEWPSLARISQSLPNLFEQTRTRPALAVGLVLAAFGAAVGVVAMLVAKRVAKLPALKLPVAWIFAAAGFAFVVSAHSARAAELSKDAQVAPMREVGLALDTALPKNALLYLAVEHDPGCCFEMQDLMFWSGRMAYRRAPDLELADRHGLHAYLVSATPEPFAPVAGVPAFAAARAYDLEQPAPLSDALPEGTIPIHAQGPGHEVLGYAVGTRDRSHDVWAFYVHGQPGFRGQLRFTLRDGSTQEASFDAGATYTDARHLASRPWVIATYVGPKADDVQRLEVDGASFDIPHK